MTNNLETGAFMPIGATSGEPIQLAMQQLMLTGRILPVGGHLLVSHGFRSAERNMLEVIYSFVLPRDAALRRFEVKGENFAVRSALKPMKEAAETYEKGLADGHLATLARQYRDGLVNLSLGNLGPDETVTVTLEILAGVELRDDGVRFRFPFTLAPSYHSKARAAEVSCGAGEVELPADLFGDVILPGFQASAKDLHQVAFDLALEMPWDVEEIASPSHAIRINRTNRVSLAPASDLPDRDLVLDIHTGQKGNGTLVGEGEDGRRHFAAVIPSTRFGVQSEAPRTVVLLLDRSGSMSGSPISQACKAAAACLAALRPEDDFGLVSFDDRCDLFRKELSKATAENRHAALQFLEGIEARGGTELAAGIKAATGLLRGSGGDVFIITDGQVFATEDILETARATGCRLHSLGIGSASQDRFLALLARETNGVSRFVTPRERVDQSALELFASVSRPVATGLKVTGVSTPAASVSPDPPACVFAGTPVLLFGDCAPHAAGSIALEFSAGKEPTSLEVPIGTSGNACGETLRLLRGSRLITDTEALLDAGDSTGARRANRRLEAYLTRLSEQYSLASRTMALVAVVERAGDKPGAPPKTHVVPVGLPQDMQFEGVFQAAPSAVMNRFLLGSSSSQRGPQAESYDVLMEARSHFDIGSCADDEQAAVGLPRLSVEENVSGEANDFDALLELSIQMQQDGGMPGKTDRDRILATLLTLLAFLADGHTAHSGPFRMHVRRMLEYLDKVLPDSLQPNEVKAARLAIKAARADKVPEGDWLALAAETHKEEKGAPERGWKALLECSWGVGIGI
jgi:Ca-activated chloride channel family protein